MSGFQCPQCGGATKVKDSRAVRGPSYVRRRRRCLNCGFRFTTYERWAESDEAANLLLKQRLTAAHRRFSDELRSLVEGGEA